MTLNDRFRRYFVATQHMERLALGALPASIAGGAGARPDHPVSVGLQPSFDALRKVYSRTNSSFLGAYTGRSPDLSPFHAKPSPASAAMPAEGCADLN